VIELIGSPSGETTDGLFYFIDSRNPTNTFLPKSQKYSTSPASNIYFAIPINPEKEGTRLDKMSKDGRILYSKEVNLIIDSVGHYR
jgi:hypothetical protein